MDASIHPEPSEEEAAVIVTALTVGVPGAPGEAQSAEPSRWRFSGRWWSRPVPARRRRPW